jgi:alkanesulfonate monooxygenase SsuD/methylene tetrahydromethanopterin reductase-like flavin-dependent oxidoreductase (luciferase family)
MKFSLIYEAQIVNPTPETEYQLFQDMVEQCVLAEKLGFNGVWAVEHTALTQYAHMSAPETFLAFIAGKTTTLEIGHGVICLPPAMNHPVKVAERIAMLDILSKGRVNFGMGKGGTQQESGTFGYNIAELPPQIDEMMYLIPKILKDGKVEHNGKFVQIPPRPVHPSTYQTPHPKLFMACTRNDTLVTAGGRGIGALVMGFAGPEEVAEKNAIYRKAFAERKLEDQVGYRPTEHLSALCATVVLKDRTRARKLGLRGQRFFAESIMHWYGAGPAPDINFDDDAEASGAAIAQNKADIVAYLGDQKIPVGDDINDLFGVAVDAYGTVEDCIRHVQKLIDAGADEIMFLNQMGGIPQDAMMETIQNIGEHVIPHFRKQENEGRRRVAPGVDFAAHH